MNDSPETYLADRQINDLASFDEHTRDERAVAGLLFYKELDCLADLAYCISLDFFDHPQLYRAVKGDTVSDLMALHVRYGHQEDFLNREQRHQIFVGVFGQCDEAGPIDATQAAPAADSFAGLRDQLLVAAAAFGERVFSTSEDLLRATVRVMHVYLKDYLQDTTGASVQWSRNDGLPAINERRCYRILRDPQIAARFAVNEEPGPEWPFRVDANGSKLVEQISSTLMRGAAEHISRGVLNDKQQLALRGAEALATVMDYDSDPDPARVDLLIRKCYIWYAARGRVLRLPVAVPAPATLALDGTRQVPASALGAGDGNVPASTSPALMPAVELVPMNGYGNRSLFGPAAPELRR